MKFGLLVVNAWYVCFDAASSLVVGIGIIGNLLGYPILGRIAAAIVGFMVARMGWRFGWDALYGRCAWRASAVPGWQDVLSRPMHYALYAFLIATPILGACCCCVVASLFASGEHAGAGVAGAEVRLLRAGARGGLGVGEAGCPRMRGAVALQAETTEWGQKKPIRVDSFRPKAEVR